MIIVSIHGGLGNQMFGYAAGLATSMRLKTELLFEIDNTGRKDRRYALGCFPAITERRATMKELVKICPHQALITFIQGDKGISRYNILGRAIRKTIYKFFRGGGLYVPRFGSYPPDFETIQDNTFLKGYFESEKIFADIAGTVRKKFTFSPECFSPELSSRIKSCNSVAVHVRMGDKAGKNSVHLCSDERYIRLAVEKLLTLTEKPSFFVFSDDIEWCKKNLPLIHEAEYTFVEGQTPQQDMALMSLCRHVIMGPSTFSWWGAWLTEYPGKIVIAPDINLWFKPGTFNPEDRKDILPERWIKIR